MNMKKSFMALAILALAAAFVFAVPIGESDAAESVTVGEVQYKTSGENQLVVITVDKSVTGTIFTPYLDGTAINEVPGQATYIVVNVTGTPAGNHTLVLKSTTYDDITVQFTVPGGTEPGEPTLTGITVDASKAKLNYTVGDDLKTANVVVKAVYSNGSEVIVTEGITYSPMVLETEGTQKITASYQGFTATYDVTVKATSEDPIDPEDMKDLTVGGIAVQKTEPTVYDVNQRVNVVSDWTLTEGAVVYIYGQLVVPAGITVTIEAGAQLILSNPSDKMNVAEIEGTLVIEEEEEKVVPGIVSVLEGTVSVSGALEISGIMVVEGGELVIEKDSNAIVEEAGILVADSKITVKEGAVLNIDGETAFAYLNVYGTVVFDSEVDSEGGFIFLMADGATVDVKMFTSSDGILMITDSELVLYSYKDKESKETVDITVGQYGNENTITLIVEATGDDVVGQLTGVKIVEKVTSKTGKISDQGYVKEAKKVYTNTTDISGNVFATAEYTGTAADAPENMDVVADIYAIGLMGITVDNGLTITDNVNFHNGGVLKVSTVIDASAEKASFKNYNETYVDLTVAGKITLSDAGEIIVYKNVITDKVGINAAYYKETVEVDKKKEVYYHYITIDAALTLVNAEGNVIDKIDVIGSNTLNASNGVPKDVTLNLNEGSKVTVGAKAGADVTLTVVKGADLKGTGTVDVKGTLLVEDKRDRVSTVIVLSDVYSEQIDADGKAVKDGWAKWTNLTTALDSAVAGDVIEIYRTTGNVEIASNTTIKAGVSVIVKDGKAPILIKNGVTLTIDGALYSEEEIYAQTLFQTTAMNVDASDVMDAKKSSTIIVNGYLITSQKAVYADSTGTALSAGAPIAGVYYEIEDYGYVISTLEKAIAVMDDIVSDNLVAYGPVTAGDVTFTANDYCEYILVSSVIVKDIDGKEIKPSLKIGSLTLVGSYVKADATVTGTVKVADSAVVFDKVVGAVVTDDEKLLLTGNVVKGDISVVAGKVTVTEKLYTAYDVDVTVDAGAEIIAEGAYIDNLYINGTVSVASAKMLRAGIVTVFENGVLSVAPLTSTTSPGVADIEALQVGIDYLEFSKDTTAAAAATVNGPVKVSAWAIVLNGAVLDDAAKASLADIDATEYYVEDALWITVYDVDAGIIVDDIAKIPVENAYFTGDWTDADGKDICDAAVGSEGAKKAYAVIDYYIYNVKVLANEGVDDVFIDGILMSHDTSNAHTAVVKAGNHEVTYKLANGYTGTAKLYVDGKAQSGMTFTTSGTPEDGESINYTLQISGIDKSGFVPESPDTPAPAEEKDEGLALTDILLIVLVILAAILVIVVAIRMMRS